MLLAAGLVAASHAGGTHAMGIFAPRQPDAHASGPSYGRFRFGEVKVVKWNCVLRGRNPAGVAAGESFYQMCVVVGDLVMVRDGRAALYRTAP